MKKDLRQIIVCEENLLEKGIEKIKVLNVRVDATTLELAAAVILGWIVQRKKTYVCVVPVSTIVECQSNPQYRDIINKADMATPDGMPLVWLGRLQGNKVIQRTYGPDLMLKLCEAGQRSGVRHYFYGGTPAVCKQLKLRLEKRFPHIRIAGMLAPPFSDQVMEEDPRILADIDRSKPDILWVALGAPKQEFWIYKHRDKMEVPVIIGVGAAFDFLAGAKKQAPKWVQSLGMEWFFRLCCEPRRLWKRYLIGNTKFIFYLLMDLFRLRSAKSI